MSGRRSGDREIDPADHARDEVAAPCDREHEAGLGDRGRGLHEHRARDLVRAQQGREIGRQEIALQRREGGLRPASSQP